jgi:hypothetical protein
MYLLEFRTPAGQITTVPIPDIQVTKLESGYRIWRKDGTSLDVRDEDLVRVED